MQNDVLLTNEEVRKILKVSRTTLWRLAKSGVLPAIKLGKSILRWKRSAVEEFLQRAESSV